MSQPLRWLACCLSALLCACGADPQQSPRLATHVDDWRDEVIYELVVDRFDNADPQNDQLGGVATRPGDLARYQGGDWRGVARRLPYLQRLGITALWISPVVANLDRTSAADGYHGYWALDFTRANPRFGELADLRRLVDAAHRRGMKVIVDVVLNHTARVFFYDLDGDGSASDPELYPAYSSAGPYAAPLVWTAPRPRVWRCPDNDCAAPPATLALGPRHFHRRGQTTDYLSAEQKERGDFPTGLRDLDTEHPEVARAMLETSLRWVLLTDVDGFRLDAVPHVPAAFWARFARELRRRLARHGKRRFLLLGEAWHTDPARVASYTRAGGLDSVFDFALKWQVIDGFILDGKPASSAVYALEQQRGLYPTVAHPDGVGLSPWQARVAFADNHDMRRLLGELHDPYAAELALTAVFTVDAVPCVYYGTEQGLSGKGGHASREVLWRGGFGEEHRTFRHLARLAQVRRELPALRRGTLVVRHASRTSARQRAPDAGLLAYERVAGSQRVLVALNGHPADAATAKVPTGFAPGVELRDALGVLRAPVIVAADHSVALTVPPRRGVILRP